MFEMGSPALFKELLGKITAATADVHNWNRRNIIPHKFNHYIKMLDRTHDTNFLAFVGKTPEKRKVPKSAFSEFVGRPDKFLVQVNTLIKRVNEENPKEKPKPLWTGAQLYQYLLRGYAPADSKNLFNIDFEMNRKMNARIFEKPLSPNTQADDLLG